METAIKTGRPAEAEAHHTALGAEAKRLHVTATPIPDESGRLGEVLQLVEDVTERRDREDALRRSEERYRSTIESADDVIFTKDRDLRYTGMNGPGLRHLDLQDEQDVVGKRATDLFSPAVAEEMETADREVLRSGRHRRGRLVLEREGRPATFEILRVPRRDAQGEIIGIIGISRDITEEMLADRHLREVYRLESMGHLCGEIAEAFNGLLGRMLETTGVEDSHAHCRERFERIRRSGMRAADLARRLVAFSRANQPRMARFCLNGAVHEVAREVSSCLERHTQLRLDLAPDLGTIEGDAVQWRDALLELCLNAQEAMPHGGELRVLSENVRVEGGDSVLRPGLSAGAYVHVAVQDTGEGVPLSLRGRAFDPMFTTRDQGNHWGMGLAIVRGVVTNHGGVIYVEHAPESGSVFHLYVPRSTLDQ